MNSIPATDAGRRYRWRTTASMSVYVLVNAAAIFGAFDRLSGTPLAWLVAAGAAIPIGIQIHALLVYLRDSDEFVRALTAKHFIIAAGGAMALFSAWGFGESYAAAPHAPGWLIYPLFWLAFGAASAFVRTSRV